MDKITIVGCGPGSIDYMTVAGLDAVSKADFLIGNKRLFEIVPDAKAEKIDIGASVRKTLEVISEKRSLGDTVLMVTGDPGMFSLAKPVLSKFGRDACVIIPGISSVQVAFAKVGLPWEDTAIISAHAGDPEIDIESYKSRGKIAVLGGREEALDWIRGFARKLGDDRAVIVCENLGLEYERVSEMTVDRLQTVILVSRTIVLFIDKELLK